MHTGLMKLAVSFLFWTVFGAFAQAEKNIALVNGNTACQHQTKPVNPSRDAASVAGKFKAAD